MISRFSSSFRCELMSLLDAHPEAFSLMIDAGKPVLQATPNADTQAIVPALDSSVLASSSSYGNSFCQAHGLKYPLYAGAMANGIASEALVIAMGKAGMLGSFGAAGLVAARVEQAIKQIQAALPNGPYCFNLIHSPSEPALEQGAVEMYLKHQVRTIEASAFLTLSPHIVHYRAAGLSRNMDGSIKISNKVIAKVSRTEVARHFMSPAPEKLLKPLLESGLINVEQYELAQKMPMADDITAEADSGGHTDNRPLVTLLPTLIALRNELQAQFQYPNAIRIGAAGGIGTPEAMLAAFAMGAAFVVTGSINQTCIEAGASKHTRNLLATIQMADVTMAPAADMFEMGVKLQVVKRGTLFPMRANKLWEIYNKYGSIETIPAEERQKLETQIFRTSLDEIWTLTQAHFNARDPMQIQRAIDNPKRKMALIFRWYLGLSSRWSNIGEPDREMDYQIWAGPALGAFNAWAASTQFAKPENRKVAEINLALLQQATRLKRLQIVEAQLGF